MLHLTWIWKPQTNDIGKKKKYYKIQKVRINTVRIYNIISIFLRKAAISQYLITMNFKMSQSSTTQLISANPVISLGPPEFCKLSRVKSLTNLERVARCQSSQLKQQVEMEVTIKPLMTYCASIFTRLKLEQTLTSPFSVSPMEWSVSQGLQQHSMGVNSMLRDP